MTAADTKALRAAMRDGRYDAAYYFHGDDDYLKDEELRSLAAAAVDPATRDFNLETLRGAELDAETLGSTVSTPPMMADRRVVILRDVQALKKDARAMLDRYLKRPADDLLLLLVSPAGVKSDKGLQSAATSIEFAPLTGNRIPKWIAYYVEHTLKTTITPGAATLLQEGVGTDLAQLKIELDKVADYTNGGPIDEPALSEVVGIRRGETLGDFLDAIAARNGPRALAMLPVILQQPKASAVTTVMALSAQTLAIGWAQAARERGTPASKLNGELFELLKTSGGVFTGRSWGEFVTACVRASNEWTPRDVDDTLALLLDADVCLKDTRFSSDEQVLGTLVLAICRPAVSRAA